MPDAPATNRPAVAAIGIRPAPTVHLVNAFDRPLDNTVATARTCYSKRVIWPEDVVKTPKARTRRDAIARSIFGAGHHTTFQHATFQFVLERVSRSFIWSFLHSHPFYNSEQVSQRYVEVAPENFVVPPLSEEGERIYRETIGAQMAGYRKLIDATAPTVRREYARIFPKRNLEEKRWAGSVEKKQFEIARYVLPVATHAHLYHTISGITLYRYRRLCELFDTPVEQRQVVDLMVEAVDRFDPEYLRLAEDPIPIEETPEFRLFEEFESALARPGRADFVRDFDASLDGRTSKLVDWKVHGERTMAEAVRSVLGVSAASLSDTRAIELVLNPARNPYLSDPLNLTTLSKLTRTMVHPHFTFRKKLSHTADSQDQRHRTTPGSRPILVRHFVPDRPDAIVPKVIERTPEARAIFDEVIARTWEGMRRLLDLGEREEAVLYLLPNAFPIRFEESGDLLAHHHKWTKRLCYTAQEEIWNASLDEVRQVARICPEVAKYLHAPCTLRKMGRVTPFCPEGDRYCGVPVWTMEPEAYDRLI